MSEFDRKQEQEKARDYLQHLDELGLKPGIGALFSCPSCARPFWFTLPMEWPDPLLGWVACPVPGCGYSGHFRTFQPCLRHAPPPEYDLRIQCPRCKTEWAANGVLFRCPGCYIENPRELMADAVRQIEARINGASPGGLTRVELEFLVSFLVSTFDGVMRGMLEVANANARHFREHDPAHPFMASMNALPPSLSFQNLSIAKERLEPAGYYMGRGSPSDWDALVRLFNKRHLIAHKLGVVDRDYMTKTGDPSAPAGKRVSLTPEEILQGASYCLRIVKSFFGGFLS